MKDLYPDLTEAGDLARLLARKMPADASISMVAQSRGWARVKSPAGRSQVWVLALERCFSMDLWKMGVSYGSGCTASIDELARALTAIHSQGVLTVADLDRCAPWFKLLPLAGSHELGPDAYVAGIWSELIDRMSRDSDGAYERRLVPLVAACYEEPRLRALLPFISMGSLGFSTTTGYPFSGDCPYAFPSDVDGIFHVQAAENNRRPPYLATGDASTCARALRLHLPTDCHGARHGTAGDQSGD